MDINPSFHELDPTSRRRMQEARAAGKSSAASPAKGGDAQAARESGEQLDLSHDIQRYVDILKDMDPVDLHRVEDLRQRIDDGSYDSDLNQLIDPLLDFLSDEESSSTEES